MNPQGYSFILSISRHRVSYGYKLEGSGLGVEYLHPGTSVSLAFYCSPSEIVVGDEALQAAESGNVNAFADYFARLSSNETYEFGGRTQPLSRLLLEASEGMFRLFYTRVLYSQKGSLDDNRGLMPLWIVCESDIDSRERAYLERLFRDGGYSRVKAVSYDSYSARYMRDYAVSNHYTCSHVLTAWTEGRDIYLTLTGMAGVSTAFAKTLPGLGRDPRLDYVKSRIWEDVLDVDPWAFRAAEEHKIEKAALDFLNSTQPEVSGTLVTSSGIEVNYGINRRDVDCLKCDEKVQLNQGVDNLLREAGLDSRRGVLLLLRGTAATNSYFENSLNRGFLQIIRSDHKIRNQIIQLILSGVDIPEHTPVPRPEHTPVPRPEHTPATQPRPQPQPNPWPKPYQPPTAPVPPPQPPTPGTSPNPEEYQREWRNIKAVAKGKVRSGKAREARQMVEEFMARCRQHGIAELLAEARKLLETVILPECGAHAPVSRPMPDPPTRTVYKPSGAGNPDPEKEMLDKWRGVKAEANGKIRSGKHDEAREMVQTYIDECRRLGVKAARAEAEVLLSDIPKPAPPPTVNEDDAREWRVLMASAKGKYRSYKDGEAIQMIQEFLRRCRDTGTKAQAEALLYKIKRGELRR